MQFQVPQFIDIEDKIIGPFTLKQFMYIAGGALLLFILFKTVKFFILIVLAGPIIALTVSLAFVKMHGQPFISIIKNFFGFLRKPDFYVWKRPKEEIQKQEEEPEIIKVVPSQKRGKLKKKERLQDVSWKINIEK